MPTGLLGGSESSRTQQGKSVYDFYHRHRLGRKTSLDHRSSSSSLLCSRRISVHQDIMAFMEGSRHEEVQEELLESNWMIYRSSPLFGVPKTEEGFSDASSSLNRIMRRLLGKRGAHNPLQASISCVKGLQGSVGDHNALKISLHITFAQEKSPVPVLVAFLLGIDSKDLGLLSENASVLPVLLVAGQKLTIQPLLEGLQVLFDTVISRVTFTQEELQWMLALWSCFEGTQKRKWIHLEYQMDKTNPGIKSIQLQLDSNDVLNLWKSIHTTLESEFTLKEMQAFYDQLYSYIQKVYGVRLHSSKIKTFSLPAVTLNQDGMITIHNVQHLKSILGYLTQRFQMNFVPTPRIGIQVDTLESFSF